MEEDEDQVSFEDTASDTDSSSSDSQAAEIRLSHLQGTLHEVVFLPLTIGPLPTEVAVVPQSASPPGDVVVPPVPPTKDASLKAASGSRHFLTWGASKLSIPGIKPLLSPNQPTRTKVIDLRGQVHCAHKVRLQTPLGPEVV